MKLNKNLKKLLNYETETGGFELFGQSPGSTTITAYGLLQFYALKKIGFELDELIEKNIKWLFSLYENGVFKLSKSIFSDFSNPPINTANTYILWVISEIYPNKLKEMDLNLNNFNNDDSYIIALIGLTYYNIGDIKNYEKMCVILENRMVNNYISGSKCSITRSLKDSLIVETNSLFILLEMKKSNNNKLKYIDLAIDYIYSQYSHGYFVSTQGTIMALLAISEYLNIDKLNNNEIVEINVNKIIKKIDLKKLDFKNKENLILYQNNLKNKELEIEIKSKSKNANIWIETNILYYKILTVDELNTNKNKYFKLDIIKIKEENNLSFFEITYENLKDEQLGMANIEFKISNCYEINHNDLNNLKNIGEIAYYEISNFGDKIIFYFRSIQKKEKNTLKFSLLKKFNNLYSENDKNIQKDISCMYLFYGKDESIIYSPLTNSENI